MFDLGQREHNCAQTVLENLEVNNNRAPGAGYIHTCCVFNINDLSAGCSEAYTQSEWMDGMPYGLERCDPRSLMTQSVILGWEWLLLRPAGTCVARTEVRLLMCLCGRD
jgi:hypothetical protein